jgi:hypothetical protein
VRSSDDRDGLVARFRPVGPPPELRERILRDAAPQTRVFAEWLPVAAALMVAVLFSWLAAHERQMLSSQLVPVPPVDQAVIEPMELIQ